jgi:formylglycine-generating enzyme
MQCLTYPQTMGVRQASTNRSGVCCHSIVTFIEAPAIFVTLNLLVLHIRVVHLTRYHMKTQGPLCSLQAIFLGCLVIASAGCGGASHPTSRHPGKISLATGAPFNDGKGGFQVPPFTQQVTGPGLVFVEGGMTVMGVVADRSPHDANPYFEKTVSVPSFFIDSTAVTNIAYGEYLDYLQKNAEDATYQAAQPDTQVWVRALAFNDSLVKNYLQHPGFRYYPVVGVSWIQANAFCEWRTKRTNEIIAQRTGNQYALDADGVLSTESGLAVADYRLPTEAEWEYAARGMTIQGDGVVQASQRIYAWDGLSLRGKEGTYTGKFMANFKRGPGNYKGIAGEHESSGATSSVYDFPPNEWGVYIGRGNVREWVYDLYRPLSSQDVEDFNPVRRDDTLDPAAGYDSKNHNSLIDNNARVVKGCSWKDCGYWLQVSTRRYLDQEAADAMTGFRCAVTSVSSMHQ